MAASLRPIGRRCPEVVRHQDVYTIVLHKQPDHVQIVLMRRNMYRSHPTLILGFPVRSGFEKHFQHLDIL